MAEEKALKFTEENAGEDGEAYAANFSAHRPGISPAEATAVYDNWAKMGLYEQDLCPERYTGPAIAANAVGNFFQQDRDKVLILDTASGTGFVGEELKKLGFERLHALDPSQEMLKIARQKNIYQKDYCCYLDNNRLPIDDDVYDCAVISGGMGGLVCIVMREEYLQHVAEYRDRLEALMKEMEVAGTWKLHSRTIVPKYSFDNNGVVFMFVVN
ncbi:hypothetical protein BaRGS_00010352 [Batillaria attramentaria]|uniref:Methyltransferase domain-containing protein n=1 Tax=Batillaria attramentaria TaxID=370345 RepID=A0ABD0LG76_9CAEN